MLEKIWPAHSNHYLFVDESVSAEAWEPYFSSSLILIQWARRNGLLEEENEPVVQAPKLHIREWETICNSLSINDWVCLKDVALRVEDDRIDSVSRALLTGVQQGILERRQFAASINYSIKSVKRWFYRRIPRANEMRQPKLGESEFHAEKGCVRKKKLSIDKAFLVADFESRRLGENVEPYRCSNCGMWHLRHKFRRGIREDE